MIVYAGFDSHKDMLELSMLKNAGVVTLQVFVLLNLIVAAVVLVTDHRSVVMVIETLFMRPSQLV